MTERLKFKTRIATAAQWRYGSLCFFLFTAPAAPGTAAPPVGWLLLFAAGFIVFKLVCRLLIWLLDLLDEVPGLHFLNHLGGAVLGVLKGGLLIAVVVSILLWCDVLPRSMVDAALLLRWLASLGPVY